MTEKALICNPNIVFRLETDGWALLFDSETGRTFVLNETGATIWQLIENHKSYEEIVVEITSIFEIDKNTSTNEFELFLVELIEKGMVILK
jgi:hypothetical protein